MAVASYGMAETVKSRGLETHYLYVHVHGHDAGRFPEQNADAFPEVMAKTTYHSLICRHVDTQMKIMSFIEVASQLMLVDSLGPEIKPGKPLLTYSAKCTACRKLVHAYPCGHLKHCNKSESAMGSRPPCKVMLRK